MTSIDRLYKYKHLLSSRRVLTVGELTKQLEISTATLKRDLARLREKFQLPVRFDRDRGGYFLESESKAVELPGLWLERNEWAALCSVLPVVTQIQPGIGGGKLEALLPALSSLMAKNGADFPISASKVSILHARKRHILGASFDSISEALTAKRRLAITHFKRDSGETLRREISPQRLVLYRDNWYLAAWCHLRGAIRTFSVDAISTAHVLPTTVLDLDEASIDKELTSSYGIFPGKAAHWAVLRFKPTSARWVKDEVWHPRQVTRHLEDGSLEMKVPFSDDRELLRDILGFGSEVVVLEPQALRARVQMTLLASAARYVERHA